MQSEIRLHHSFRASPAAGFLETKTLLVLLLIGLAVVATFKVVPAYYDFGILKDLANRVVHEFPDEDLPLHEVIFRVKFEIDRSNIDVPEDAFQVFKEGNGYRVVIDYELPVGIYWGDVDEIEEGEDVPGIEHILVFKYEVKT